VSWSDTEITFTFVRTSQPYSIGVEADAFRVLAYVILAGSFEVEGALSEVLHTATTHDPASTRTRTWLYDGEFSPRTRVAELFANVLGRATNDNPWLFDIGKGLVGSDPSEEPSEWFTIESNGSITNYVSGTVSIGVYRPVTGWITIEVSLAQVQDIDTFLQKAMEVAFFFDAVPFYREVLPPAVTKPSVCLLNLFGSVESAFGADTSTAHRRYETRVVGPSFVDILGYNSTLRSALKRNAGGIVQDTFLVSERTYYDDVSRLYVCATEYEVHYTEI
jgi:hypothetical protein